MVTELAPVTKLVPVEDGGGFIVIETVPRTPPGKMYSVPRIRVWGVLHPIEGKWQPTDPDGNDVGGPVNKLGDAVNVLFQPVRTPNA